jgi:GNAT superfamily N-acetyltransferase
LRGASDWVVYGPVKVVPADWEDASELAELRDEAARWQISEGIQQWSPGELSVGDITVQIDAGQWFVVREHEIVAAVRILWSDPSIWGNAPADGAYVHGLMVRRSRAGVGLGAELLAWAERRAAEAGRCFLRLDCVDTNSRLCRYYEDRGYQRVGRKILSKPWLSVALFEKRILAKL